MAPIKLGHDVIVRRLREIEQRAREWASNPSLSADVNEVYFDEIARQLAALIRDIDPEA